MATVIRKPWGREILYALGPGYAGKIIIVERGRRLSLQYHERKHETIHVLEGRLVLRIEDRERVLKAGSGAVIPPGTVHRFEARFGRVTVLEVSTPELSDVVRLEDDFDRVGVPAERVYEKVVEGRKAGNCGRAKHLRRVRRKK
ncbi:MAG: cupin domain-containing protein [Elusimicrobiota bacterium]|jgi:mannose-6-phosphate isomerase-like protein (cupin superfamily)